MHTRNYFGQALGLFKHVKKPRTLKHPTKARAIDELYSAVALSYTICVQSVALTKGRIVGLCVLFTFFFHFFSDCVGSVG